jgi:hypothetical protein
MSPQGRGDDKERAVNVPPPDEARAASRLLDHCTRVAGAAAAKPQARERLEAALGGELARRLIGALSGDHRLPARVL